jgi:tripartite-type tricarboxylate transporter receptor subunit TctC
VIAKLLARLLFSAALVATCAAAAAQDAKFPNRPVRIMVPFNAGTLTDVLARAYAARLSENLKQPFIVENKPGAGGVVAGQAMLGAPADGHVLMFVSSAHAANPSLIKAIPYDTTKEFSGVALVADSPTVIAVRPGLGVKTQAELIAYAKANPGKLNFSTPGLGSASHFACEYFKTKAGIEMQHIPFKGPEYVSELIAGRVDVACPPVGLATPYMKDNSLLALSVTSAKRVPSMPNVPTAAEAGLPNYEYGIWYGLIASSKTPKPVLQQLADQLATLSTEPVIVDAMRRQGIVPRVMTLATFDEFIASEITKLQTLAKANGVVAQ